MSKHNKKWSSYYNERHASSSEDISDFSADNSTSDIVELAESNHGEAVMGVDLSATNDFTAVSSGDILASGNGATMAENEVMSMVDNILENEEASAAEGMISVEVVEPAVKDDALLGFCEPDNKTSAFDEQPGEEEPMCIDKIITGYAMVKTTLNVRAEPALAAKVITDVPNGTKFVIDRSKSTELFWCICTPKIPIGYCLKRFVRIEG